MLGKKKGERDGGQKRERKGLTNLGWITLRTFRSNSNAKRMKRVYARNNVP